MKDKLIGALVGLARATDGDERQFTPTATAFIVRALNGLPGAAEWQLGYAMEEKRKIVPNCFQCASPCGRTADYDMKKLHSAPPMVREAKLQILAELKALAADFRGEHSVLLYKGLIYLGLDDLEVDAYTAVAEEIHRTIN